MRKLIVRGTIAAGIFLVIAGLMFFAKHKPAIGYTLTPAGLLIVFVALVATLPGDLNYSDRTRRENYRNAALRLRAEILAVSFTCGLLLVGLGVVALATCDAIGVGASLLGEGVAAAVVAAIAVSNSNPHEEHQG